jgi:hypothetical protein
VYMFNILMGASVKKLVFVCVCVCDGSLLKALLIQWTMLETFLKSHLHFCVCTFRKI